MSEGRNPRKASSGLGEIDHRMRMYTPKRLPVTASLKSPPAEPALFGLDWATIVPDVAIHGGIGALACCS